MAETRQDEGVLDPVSPKATGAGEEEVSSTSEPDLEFEDNHPFIVEVRKNRDPHASKDDARGTNIMGVRMLASTFSARRFCATYRLKTTSSFSVPTPYTLENAMILAVEVQYRYQFFYDIQRV